MKSSGQTPSALIALIALIVRVLREVYVVRHYAQTIYV